jgi:sn-glycerol 3-phosphate transport system permease protein
MNDDARALHRRRVWSKVGRYTLLTVLAVIVLFPIYITVVNSLLPPVDITHQPPKLFPSHPQWSSYSDAWSAGHMGTYLKNSFIVTFVITVGQVLTAILAGYAFAFLRFPFKRTLFVVFLATGFGAFLMRQAFLTMPGELRDAAALDGYGHWRFLWRVAVPLARPAVAALTVFAFLAAWNQYLWPLLITKDDKLRTVQIGLKQLQSVSIDQINITFAGAVIAVIPLVILLLFFQKQLVRGLTAGAVKG